MKITVFKGPRREQEIVLLLMLYYITCPVAQLHPLSLSSGDYWKEGRIICPDPDFPAHPPGSLTVMQNSVVLLPIPCAEPTSLPVRVYGPMAGGKRNPQLDLLHICFGI